MSSTAMSHQSTIYLSFSRWRGFYLFQVEGRLNLRLRTWTPVRNLSRDQREDECKHRGENHLHVETGLCYLQEEKDKNWTNVNNSIQTTRFSCEKFTRRYIHVQKEIHTTITFSLKVTFQLFPSPIIHCYLCVPVGSVCSLPPADSVIWIRDVALGEVLQRCTVVTSMGAFV